MKYRGSEVVPVAPGTLLRMSPEKHPDGQFVRQEKMFGRDVVEQGQPVFEVKSYVLDCEGGHVTLEREAGTWYMLGVGNFIDRKFPYPHPMFEIVDAGEARQIRCQMAVAAGRQARSRWRWPAWLRRARLAYYA